jgi:hypothetical protein
MHFDGLLSFHKICGVILTYRDRSFRRYLCPIIAVIISRMTTGAAAIH